MNIKQKIAAVLAVLGLGGYFGGEMLVGAGQYYFPYQGGTGTQTAPTSGQLLIGTSTGVYVPAGLTAGTGVTITPGSGAITISATGGGGGGSAIGLRAGFSGAFSNKTSVSFDAGAFNVDTSNVDGRVFLDYTNGPASRAMANTWTAHNIFSTTASVTTAFEVGTSGLWTNGTNVGIGTNTPKGKLTVAGAAAQIIASGSGTVGLRLNATNSANSEGLFQLNSLSTFDTLRLTNGAGTVLSDVSSRGFTSIYGTAVGTNTGTVMTLYTAQERVKGLVLNNASGNPLVNYLEFQLNGNQSGAFTSGPSLILGSSIKNVETGSRVEIEGSMVASQSVNSFVGYYMNDTNAEATQPGQRKFSIGTNGGTEQFVLRDGNNSAILTVSSAGWTSIKGSPVIGTYLNIATATTGTKLLILNNATGNPAGVTMLEWQLNGSRNGFVGGAGAQLGLGAAVRDIDTFTAIEAYGNIVASQSLNSFVGFVSNDTVNEATQPGQRKFQFGSYTEQFIILNGAGAGLMSLASTSTSPTGSYINAGNFGIGDTSPTTALDVSGSASVSARFEIGTYPAIGSTADALCKGTSGVISTNTGSPTCTVSSEKYKRNVTQLTSALDIIRELQPVTFINKGDPYNREHFGLVAEQVAQVEPRLVFYEVQRTLKTKVLDHMKDNPKYEPKDEDYTETLTNDPRGVKYEEVVGVLVGAMKEQQAQIDSLDARLTALEGGKAGGPPFPREQSFWSKIWQFIINLF